MHNRVKIYDDSLENYRWDEDYGWNECLLKWKGELASRTVVKETIGVRCESSRICEGLLFV